MNSWITLRCSSSLLGIGRDMKTKGYVDKIGSRVTRYSFIKIIEYNVADVNEVVERLERLKITKFNFINIPKFTYKVYHNKLKIESEFIKGWYCLDVNSIYNDLVNSEWTFTDPRPSNFMTCKQNNKTYALDLDSFDYIPLIEDRKKLWIKYNNKWPVWPYRTYNFDENGIVENDS